MTALASRLSALGLIALVGSEALAQNPPVTPPIQPPVNPTAQRGGGGNRGRGAIRIMTLTSSALQDGGMIPDKHAQRGRDVSPALSWSGAPDSIVSYVLLVHDADAAGGDGTDDVLHWLVWGIPGSMKSLPEGIKQGPTVRIDSANVRQLSVSGPYYRGPAAPSTGPTHHYVFELFALDANINVQPVIQNAGLTRRLVMEAIENHVRGKGVLVGLYRRAEPPQP
jgi:Raf kinase inhibitor-like YbhB/YbcL family protein